MTNRTNWWCLAVAGLLPGLAAAEWRADPTVVVRPHEVIEGDLYVTANSVRIEGVVKGDLVAAAGTVEIPGEVKGDVLAAAGTLRVSGHVGGSLRSLGGQLQLTGAVGEDVLAAAGEFDSEPGASIGRDVLVGGGTVRLHGPVGGDVDVSAATVVLDAPVAGKVELTVDTLALEAGARVDGSLHYRSPREARLAPGARTGLLTRAEPDQPSPMGRLLLFLALWGRAFFAFSVLGVLLALVSPRFARTVPEVLRQAPWHSLGWGALALVLAPFVGLLLFLAGLALGGWWLGLISAAVVLTAIATSFPVVGYQLGQLVLPRRASSTGSRIVALLTGVGMVTLGTRVPGLGVLIGVLVALFGVGSMLLAGLRLRRGAST